MNNNPSSKPAWSQEDRERVRELWINSGMSASQIAAEFPGKSRNAIIGIVYRMGLSGTRQRKAPFVKKVPLKHQPEPVDDLAAVGPLHLSLFDLTKRTCKFPFGTETPFTFCGHVTAPGLPYCKAHCLMAYQAPAVRNREPRPREKINF